MKLFLIISTVFTIVLNSAFFAQEDKKSKNSKEEPAKEKKVTIKPFNEVITANAKTTKGLFIVHQVEDKWYFELNDTLFGKEIMAVTRFSQTAAGTGMYGGEEINSQVVKWEKGPANKIYLKSITYVTTSSDSTKPIFQAVKNSSADPIIAAFPIVSIKKDTSILIEVGDYFAADNQSFSVDPEKKNELKITSFDKEKSFVRKISSFPINTEVRTIKTFQVKSYDEKGMSTPVPAGQVTGLVTLELNTSFILLPKVPMKKRLFDGRVGFFANELITYGENSHKAQSETFITRWRLEPKNEADALRQAKGELIEPKKPIVYYIDPATPDKWKKYLKAGIDDWKVAFEQAGWKNAIRGEYWPENDSTMNLEDARFSVIRYFASDIQNAYGPKVYDPRSGEILESHIGWYHNVMALLHDWYFIQATPNDPRARMNTYDDALMGELIRFVAAHEVGHTLGLRHNMGASSATPVEKLRDKNWVKENGHTSSIMDYARFNYVAQPEDGVTDLFPRVGDYDKWAIQWGYSYLKDVVDPQADKKALNALVIEKNKNPRLRFGTERSPYDPRFQTEDLGDNAMKASAYGIKNLQRILPNLNTWTKEQGEAYQELDNMYSNVVSQYNRYVNHVIKNVGGIYQTPKTTDMEGDEFEVVAKNTQLEALTFLNKYVFQTPTWLVDPTLLAKIKPESGVEQIKTIQTNSLNSLLNGERLVRILETSALSPANLKIEDLFTNLKQAIFSELNTTTPTDIYRRNLQKTYVSTLIPLLNPTKVMVRSIPSGATWEMNYKLVDLSLTDVPSVVRYSLDMLRKEIKTKLTTTTDLSTKIHLTDLLNRINLALEPR